MALRRVSYWATTVDASVAGFPAVLGVIAPFFFH
jgi:hypothetical protein